MNKTRISFALVLTALLAVGVAVAGHHEGAVTLQGKIACAKCTLETGAEDCQDVLVVKKGEEIKHFYMVKNEVAKEFGHVCSDYKAAVVTGTVEEKDGKMWMTASKIVAPEKG